MHKLLSILICCFLTQQLFAADSLSKATVFTKGDHIITIAAGAPGTYITDSKSPSPDSGTIQMQMWHSKYQYGITSTIGLGVNLSYTKRRDIQHHNLYDYPTQAYSKISYSKTTTYYNINPQVTYHLYRLIPVQTADLYISGGPCLSLERAIYSKSFLPYEKNEDKYIFSPVIKIGSLIYIAKTNLAAGIEVGYERRSYLTLSLNYKF